MFGPRVDADVRLRQKRKSCDALRLKSVCFDIEERSPCKFRSVNERLPYESLVVKPVGVSFKELGNTVLAFQRGRP